MSGSGGQRDGANFRGQPLLVLGALLIGWTCVRAILWDAPFDVRSDTSPIFAAGPLMPQAQPSGIPNQTMPAERGVSMPSEPLDPLVPAALAPLQLPPHAWQAPYNAPTVAAPASARMVVGSNLLMLAGFSQMDLPPVVRAYLEAAQKNPQRQAGLLPAPPAPGVHAATPRPLRLATSLAARPQVSRWSGDGWILLRDDSVSPFLSGRPSYGRSQAGAIIRYRLAPGVEGFGGHGPQIYARTSAALAGQREVEVAAGLSVKPIARVPVRVAAELRAGDTNLGTKLRPAAYAVTEFAPLSLPFGVQAEAYAQAGYVGGEFATAFADGQLRMSKNVITVSESDDAHINAGAGAWGGAQQGAARLDIGPSAAVSFRLGQVRSRLAVDYRIRVSGDAEPASGPALTLSAGF